MAENPKMRFISLFVPDLEVAVARYEAMLGVAVSSDPGAAPRGHPFGAAGPVVFELGEVSLALYQCDGRATHPGDVGLGLSLEESPAALASRASAAGGKVFYGPERISAEDSRDMTVFVLPDRHFFEVVGPDDD